ncbi:uncharacterized protein LOC144036088 [Vanacampus margaritifer]
MDVQTENVDPPPSESQPSGKIRKGFKLFGKRKPGNIFSLKNTKSPVTRSQTLDGLPEGGAPDSELEADKEKAREVSQGDCERAEEEPTGEDGVLAAARNSISSTGSAKSLSFFSRLRGARRGGDRKIHTVSQPVPRQRQGLKNLFGSMKLRPKDEDKVDAPPSPLLMSSRSNSVEIIKEDIGLTPKSHPRSLESHEKASGESSPTGDLSKTDHASPVPATEPPAVPTESSLGSLLDDISSLLTFESISGGDIMADMKAEWGKARCAPSLEAPEVSASATSPSPGPATTSPLTSSSSVAAGGHSITSVATPVVTSLTKSSTLTTESVKPSSDSFPASEKPSIEITIKSPSTTTTVKLSSTPPIMSTPSITMKTIPSSTPFNQASLDKTQVTTCNSTLGKVALSDAEPPPHSSPSPTAASVSKPPAVATLLSSHKPATHSLYSPPTFTQSDSNGQTSSSAKPQNVAAKVETAPSPVRSQPPLIPHTTITTTMPTISKPVQTSSQQVSNGVSVTEPSPTTFTSFSMAKKSPLCLDKELPSPPVAGQGPVSQSRSPPQPVTLSKDRHVPAPFVTVSKDPPVPASFVTVSKDRHVPASFVTVSKDPPVLASFVTVSKDLPVPASSVTVSKDPPVPAPFVTVSKDPPVPASFVTVSKDPPVPASFVTVSKDPPVPAPFVTVSKDPLVTVSKDSVAVPTSTKPPAQAHMSVSMTKSPPAPVQIPVTQSKAPFLPVPSLPATTPVPLPSETATSNKMSANEPSTNGQLSRPSSTDAQIAKVEEQQNGSRMDLPKGRRTQGKALSKIPVVGGGRAGKLPVRDSQHTDDDSGRDPPTPTDEDRRHLDFHNTGSRDKGGSVDVHVAPFKHSQEESPSPQQSKAPAGGPRDSKIPVKHGAQSPPGSQIPPAKETPRTKIPVSRVPVRRSVGNKPATAGAVRK